MRSAATAPPSDAAASELMPLPRSPVEMVRQAADAVRRGLEAGKTRQALELLLPVNEKSTLPDFHSWFILGVTGTFHWAALLLCSSFE